MKKMNLYFVLVQSIVLILVLGGGILMFGKFAPGLYRNYRINIAKEAFEELKDVDLKSIRAEEVDLQSYETMNYIFTIADESMKAVYRSPGAGTDAIYRNIERRVSEFKSTPVIIRSKNQNRELVRLQGIIEQNGKTYYVSIRDRIKDVGISFRFSMSYLWCLFAILFVVEAVFMYLLSKKIINPIGKLDMVVNSVAKQEFAGCPDDMGSFEELNQLAVSINKMSEQTQQYVVDIENNKDRIMLQKVEQERMNRARKEFISNVSHKLKTPLAVISSQVEMLQYLKEEEKKRIYYESIQEEVAKMSEMVGNLLEMNIIEHNMGKVEKKEFSLNETVEYILMKYESLFKQKIIKVEKQLIENCNIYGDREFIEQAVNNFVMNALQHTEKGKKIRLIIQEDGDNVEVRIFNQGMPIDSEGMDKIWNSFYVMDQDKEKDEDNGLGHTGLGLYIVKTIMEMHGGKYGVRNLDDGVEFWISIPKGL